MLKMLFKKAFWWRLYYYFFSDFFEGMTLKEVLFGEYGAEDYVLVRKWVPEHKRMINNKQVVVRGYYKTVQLQKTKGDD